MHGPGTGIRIQEHWLGEEGIPLLPADHLTGSPEGWGVPVVLEETPAG